MIHMPTRFTFFLPFLLLLVAVMEPCHADVVRNLPDDGRFDINGTHDGSIATRPYTVIVDNGGAGTSSNGSWSATTTVRIGWREYFGTNIHEAAVPASDPEDTWYRWTPTLAHSGFYKVFVQWCDWGDGTTAHYTVVSDGVLYTVDKNQTASGTGARWQFLGFFNMDGSGDYVQVDCSAGTEAKYVLADAVKFELVGQSSLERQCNGFTDRMFWIEEPSDWFYRVTDIATYDNYERNWSIQSTLTNTHRWVKYIPSGTTGVSDIIIDDEDAAQSFTNPGNWTQASPPASGTAYNDDHYWTATGDGSDKSRWTPDIQTAGWYNIYLWHTEHVNWSTDAPYTVVHAGGSTTTDVNQEINGNQWWKLGAYYFNTGTDGYIELTDDANQYVVADAVKFEYGPFEILDETDDFGAEFYIRPLSSYFYGHFGFFYMDSSTAVVNFIGLRVYFDTGGGDDIPYDVSAVIFDDAGNSDSSAVGDKKLKVGNDYRVKLQYTASTGVLSTTIYDLSDNVIWTDSSTLTGGRTFNVTEFGASSLGVANGGPVDFGDSIKVWTGTSETYQAGTWTSDPIPVSYGLVTTNGSYSIDDPYQPAAILSDRNGCRITGTYDRMYLSYMTTGFLCWLRYYDLDSNLWGDPVYIGTAADDHGVGYLVEDHQGKLNIFYGAHASTLYHKRTGTAEDLTTLTSLASPGSEVTYPYVFLVNTDDLLLVYAGPWVGSLYRPLYYKYGTWNGTDGWNWGSETMLCRWDEVTAHRIYFHLAQQETTGDVYIGCYKTTQFAASPTTKFIWKWDNSSSAWQNADSEALTLPLYLNFPSDTIDSVTSSSITLTTNSSIDDYWNGKWIQDDTTLNCYLVTDWDQATKTAAVTGDPSAETGAVHIVEKYCRINADAGGAGTVCLGGTTLIGIQLARDTNDANEGAYWVRWDNTNKEWDSFLVYAVVGEGGPSYCADASNVEHIRYEDTGTVIRAQYYRSTDGGENWSVDSTLHERYLYETQYNRSIKLGDSYEIDSELIYMFNEKNSLVAEAGPNQVLAFGTEYPDYVSSHNFQMIDWTETGTGDATVQIRAATSAWDLDGGGPATWRTVIDGQSNFASWAEFGDADWFQVKIEINSALSVDDLTATLGSNVYSGRGIGRGISRGIMR